MRSICVSILVGLAATLAPAGCGTELTGLSGGQRELSAGYRQWDLARAAAPRGLTTGVGLSPPTPDVAGIVDAFETASNIADVGIVQVTFAWDALRGDREYHTYKSDYGWLIQPEGRSEKNLFDEHALGRGFWLDFLESTNRSRLNLGDYPEPAGFTDPRVAAAYIDECVWLAGYLEPDLFAIGTEIDDYLLHSSDEEREALLAAVVAAHDAIKASHPGMVVFVYFQYENVVAQGLWDLIRPFAAISDMVAFSSHPSIPVKGASGGYTAANLPQDYYAAIATELAPAQQVGLAELSHPAGASELFPSGSEQEQAMFIERFFSILPANTGMVVWVYLFDPDLDEVQPPELAAYFGSTGLLRSDVGTATP